MKSYFSSSRCVLCGLGLWFLSGWLLPAAFPHQLWGHHVLMVVLLTLGLGIFFFFFFNKFLISYAQDTKSQAFCVLLSMCQSLLPSQ